MDGFRSPNASKLLEARDVRREIRRGRNEVGLSNILERIVETLRDNTEVSYLFLKPVSKEAPDYLNIVKHPMDLSTIWNKVRLMEYKDREDFRHDVWQIAYNVHIYNDGINPGIPPFTDQLLELCDYLLHEYAHSLDEAEAGFRGVQALKSHGNRALYMCTQNLRGAFVDALGSQGSAQLKSSGVRLPLSLPMPAMKHASLGV
ncbi:hypothetical protein F3Y22_tig00003398pilonHSYRG00133 [Hibiscus syriacus]|uniref:Bromo domain-containing protein n=1 Tax=Hibiscus syriacus TaxID=106335 RepID=A0A6A3CRC0_HIBSY|nr:hypothetical protein F3Y22_tig00003398pilonHSYRG00133 [Hibiscus syriacus]